MESLRVDLGRRSYDIIIRSGALEDLRALLRSVGRWSQVMLVTNPTVYRAMENNSAIGWALTTGNWS